MFFVFSINVFHRGLLQTTLENQLDQRCGVKSVGFAPEFLRKHIATCDFSGESTLPAPHLDLPKSSGEQFCQAEIQLW